MMGHRLIEEVYLDRHRRAFRVSSGGVRVYSMDYYSKLDPSTLNVECRSELTLDLAKLCYVDLGEGCEALILFTPGRSEVISLRLYALLGNDPAGGDPRKALELCSRMLARKHPELAAGQPRSSPNS